jgi:hypothetical protein
MKKKEKEKEKKKKKKRGHDLGGWPETSNVGKGRLVPSLTLDTIWKLKSKKATQRPKKQ